MACAATFSCLASYVSIPYSSLPLGVFSRDLYRIIKLFSQIMSDGKGEGFGNPISIQTVAIVRAAKAMKRMYRVDTDRPVSITHCRSVSL